MRAYSLGPRVLPPFQAGLILLAVGLSLLAARPVAGQQICTDELASCDLQTNQACLARTYACGRYDTVVRTLFIEDFAPTLDQKYYIGASMYGLYIRARAKSLECEYVKTGKEYLFDYLTAKELEFTTGGSFGTVVQMDQLYHATRMYDALEAVPGCVESAFTRARVQAIARAEAIDSSKSVFLRPSDQMRASFDTIVLALRSFVSRASDLETGVALRRVEIQSANTHLDVIKAIFAEIFGTVSVENNAVSVNTATLDGLEQKAGGFLADVEVEQAEFKAALGGVTPEQYADIRTENIRNAEQMLKESAFHINMIGELLPTDTNRPFWKLWQILNAAGDEKLAADNLAAVKAGWKAHGQSVGICASPSAAQERWYCR